MGGARLAVCVAIGAILLVPAASSARESAGTPLTLKGVVIDKRGILLEHWSARQGNAEWTPPFGHATYRFPLPSRIPAGGTTLTLEVTAKSAPTSRFAPAFGISGNIDIKGTPQVSALSEAGQVVTGKSTVKLVPRTYGKDARINVVVSMQDGPTVTYQYRSAVTTTTEKYRFSVSGKNRIGSRISGSGSITRTQVADGASTRTSFDAGGAIVHVDEYFTEDQDERLALRIVRGEWVFDGLSAKLVTVAVRVTSSSHPQQCPVGSEGVLKVIERPGSKNDGAALRVCGTEHAHTYASTAKFPVKVSITKIG